MPQPPSTLEGAYLLHLFFRVDWSAWHALKDKKRQKLQRQSALLLNQLQGTRGVLGGGEKPPLDRQTRGVLGGGEDSAGYYHVLGHKGDLLFLFSRATPQHLAEVERDLTQLPIWPYLELSYSYFSVVELSLHGAYDRYRKLLLQQGLEEGSTAWDLALEAMLEQDRQVQRARLYPEIPPQDYICFYPMDKRRGELKNWFMLEAPERGKLMSAHGKTGRRYVDKVTQIVSSSMALDDYDWGVDLFSNDTLQFKKLIYEMRFDEVSAAYAEFGPFMIGRRLDPEKLLELRPWPSQAGLSPEPTPATGAIEAEEAGPSSD